MAIDTKVEENFNKIAKFISVEASAKFSSLLNRKIHISFSRLFESSMHGEKIDTELKNAYLYSSYVEEPELGPIALLTTKEQMLPIIGFLQDQEVEDKEADIPDNLQMLIADAIHTTFVAISKRFTQYNSKIKFKLADKEFRALDSKDPDSMRVPEGARDTLGIGFKLNISGTDFPLHIETNSGLVEFLVKEFKDIIEAINFAEFEEEIYKEYGVKLELNGGDLVNASGDDEASLTKVDPKRNLNILRDINMELIVELGRSEMTMKDVLRLTRGSAIELDRQCSEPIDVYVHNQLVARGEVVAIDENFGIKITQVLGDLNLANKLGLKPKLIAG